MELEGTAELDCELDTEEVLEVEGTAELDLELEAEEVAEIVDTVGVVLEAEDVLELLDELSVEDFDETTGEDIELDFVLTTELDTEVTVVECELDD